jgi:hypothetical protein
MKDSQLSFSNPEADPDTSTTAWLPPSSPEKAFVTLGPSLQRYHIEILKTPLKVIMGYVRHGLWGTPRGLF